MPRCFRIAFICLNISAFTGCLATDGGSANSGSSTPATTTDISYAGVSAVETTNGSTLKITWPLSTDSRVIGYRVYERISDGTLTAIVEVSQGISSYSHTGLSVGSFHNYVVRAFTSQSLTDPNTNFKGNYTYAGATSVSITGTTSATINFAAGGSFATSVKVYASARGTTTFLGSVSNTATSYSATGLNSGTTYSFFTRTVNSSGTEDSNTVTVQGQTTPTWSSRYQGPILVQAFGNAPTAPSGTPQGRQVSVTWAPFSAANALTSYALIRVAHGGVFDLTTTALCTSSLSTSCRVCTATGSSAKTCTDTNVGAPPVAYDYIVTLNQSSWPEESPASGDTNYRITVPIPPDNMVLVHRDSVNYEFCQSMGRSSDPVNHQRCAINGASMLGATPYNTGPGKGALNLNTGFYDFGYNFFVDRWESACNWTPSTSGGMCGTAATAGDCFGNGGSPSSTIGVDGNVYYNTNSGSCYVKQSGTWFDGNSSSISSTNRGLLRTNIPSTAARKPPLVNIDQYRSYDSCQAEEDPNYGRKRLLRQREWSASAAMPYLAGEPNALTDGEISTIDNGYSGATTHTALGYCNSNLHTGISASAFNASELAGDISNAILSFTIGASGTKSCVSRFGAQDMTGNVHEWVSENMTCNGTTRICSGTQSLTDSGNGYTSGFDMNGFLFDGTSGPTGIDTAICATPTLTGQTDPPPSGSGAVGDTALSVTNTCYIKRDATTWVTTGSASIIEGTRMHGIRAWTINGGLLGGTTESTGMGAGYFNLSLGIPMVSTNNSNAISTYTNAKIHSDYYELYISKASSYPTRGLFVGGNWNSGNSGGRWFSSWGFSPSGTSATLGLRCGLPAE